MAPTIRKEVYEKNAWCWVENCPPAEVSDEHVRTAYRINLSRCKIGACRRNCKGNPFCLSNLGEHRWLGSHEDAFSDHVLDPEKERRKSGNYVGLKNLGATCYVNSLLQLWFHNLNFRKAIFLWDPFQDAEEKQNSTIFEEKYTPSSVLGHLQAVFALMRYGERRFVDPTSFILSLRLDTSVQQDAQEFSKLFLSKLETTLSYQSAKEVRDLIKDNFCGEYSYVTRCMKCMMESKRPSTFYELDLNIKGHRTIQDCLREFMTTEMLEGDDKYFCQICGDKQDAQRFISLTELPPVLNLQLMRFVFDKNTGYKKKLNTFVQFPDKLNMSEFCPNVQGNMEYALSAVLVHGGRSANSGHYVAHISDGETGTWYKFNDESVEKIEGKKLKLGTEDEYEDGGKKMKIPRAPKGSYHSPNAYMLVYTRNDVVVSAPQRDEIRASGDKQTAAEWKLPPHLENFVRDQNQQFENWVADIQKTNDMALGRNHHLQLEMATNITLLSVESSGNLEAVPTSWLTRWLSDPDLECGIDNRKHACCHGKLDPNEISNIKYINSEMADKLFDKYGGEPRFKYSDFLCYDCVFAKYLKIRVKNQTQNEFKFISNKLKTKLCDSEMGYWVGKVSLRSWRRIVLENLENGLLDRISIESLLSDVKVKPSKGAGSVASSLAAMSSFKNEAAEMSRTENKATQMGANSRATCETRKFRSTNGQIDYENVDAAAADPRWEWKRTLKPQQQQQQQQQRCSPRFFVVSKLEECYSVSVANRNDPFLRELCKPLKNVLSRAKNVGGEPTFKLEEAKTETAAVAVMPEEEEKAAVAAAKTTADIASSYNGAYRSFLQNRDKTWQNSGTDASDRNTKLIDGRNNDASALSKVGGYRVDAGDGDGQDDDVRCRRSRRNDSNSYNNNGLNAEYRSHLYSDLNNDDDDDDDDDADDVNGGDGDDEDDGDGDEREQVQVEDDDEDDDHDHDHDHEDDDEDDEDENEMALARCGDLGRDRHRRRRSRHRRRRPSQQHLSDDQLRHPTAADGYGGRVLENGDGNDAIRPNKTSEEAMGAPLPRRTDDLQIRLNGGDAVGTSAAATDRTKCVADNVGDDGSYLEAKFNDDLLCFHGNLCVEENNRKLVPEQVWRMMKKYFPYVNEFTSSSQPCGLCKSIASEAEVAKDMYKTGAVNQKEALGDLYYDRNRPQLVYRNSVDADADADVENEFYLINKEFINSWRKFIRENGKKEPPYSIRNQSWLLCDHLGLLYDLNQRIPNTIVVITRREWQLLCATYNADCEIFVKCMLDGTVITEPDVCVPCMRRRIEMEEKAQLCYSKAKIYIKVQNDDEAEYLSNEEARPPAKRAKLSTTFNGNGCLNVTTTTNSSAATTAKGVNGGECGEAFDFAAASERSNHVTYPADGCINRNRNRNLNPNADVDDAGRQNSAVASVAMNRRPASTCIDATTELAQGVADAAATAAVTAVRRSSRCRRVRGVKEIVVSSDLTLLDVKKKICEMMSVAPMDQHLFTSDGRSLTENAATLTELSIYPESVLNLKVDEPCEGVITDEFIIDREPEAGFKGTGLVGS